MSAHNLGPPGNVAGPDPTPGAEANRDRDAANGSSLPTVPPTIDPKAVRRGRVARFTLRQTIAGGCQEQGCGLAWTGPPAFLQATAHTLRTGHGTVVGRTVAYAYQPAGGV